MTPDSRLHPSHDDLVAFGLGKLDDEAHQRIERHVEECTECCQILRELPADTVVSLLADPVADTSVFPDEAAVRWAADTGTLPAGEPQVDGDVPASLRDHPRFRILGLLARGGMGDVYKAEHRMMQRPLAVKVINRDLVKNPAAVERFCREAQAAARLHHRNIVTAYDAEQLGDVHLLAMEFIEGCDLAEVVSRRGPLPIDEACRYVQQAADGLQHAYQAGMIHRDIKPRNLMLTAAGEIKILDFGLAGLIVDAVLADGDPTNAQQGEAITLASLTALGSMMGTPDYVAPEQARDARSADIRADIYGLGCTLYFLLTGKPPFPDGSVIDKVRAHQEQLPPPVSQVRDDVPPQLELVLARMMAKDPTARYRRPADVVEVLRPFADGVTPDALAGLSESPRTPPRVRSLVQIAAGLILGTVIWIVSDRGRIEIQSEVDDVKVVVSQNGREVKIIDLQTDSSVRWLSSGSYEVRLKSDRNDVKLSPDAFTIKRLGKRIVHVTKVDQGDHADAGSQAAAASPALEQQPSSRPTASAASNTWRDIFDGRTLEGWEIDGSASWVVEEGVLVGRGGTGHGRLLYTRESFENLEVRAECRINAAGNSGIYVRTKIGSQFNNGYEAQITTLTDQVTWTGGIWPQTRFRRRVVEDDTWFVLEVRAIDNVISVKVNGVQTSQYTDDQRQFRDGLIGLQAWGKSTEVSFRRIQLRGLHESESENLITDSSLEGSPVGEAFPPGWGNFNAEPKDGYRFELVEGGRTGQHGWLIEGEGTYITVPTNRVPIVAGRRYVGRGWVKLSGSGAAQVRLLYFDKNRTYIGESGVGSTTAGDQWRQVSITDRIADFPHTHFVALAMSVIGNGRAVFDDLELRAVAPQSLDQQ